MPIDARIPLSGSKVSFSQPLIDLQERNRRDRIDQSNLKTAEMQQFNLQQTNQLNEMALTQKSSEQKARGMAAIVQELGAMEVLFDDGQVKSALKQGMVVRGRLEELGEDTAGWDEWMLKAQTSPEGAAAASEYLGSFANEISAQVPALFTAAGIDLSEPETFTTEFRDGVPVQVSSTTNQEFDSPRAKDADESGFTNIKQLDSGGFVGLKDGEIQVIPATEAANLLLSQKEEESTFTNVKQLESGEFVGLLDGEITVIPESEAAELLLNQEGEAEAPTSSQSLAAGFAQRTLDSGNIITEIGDKFTGAVSRAVGIVPRGFQFQNRQRFDQATRDFISATLRRESGAAIQQSEFDYANLQYIPQPGDKEDVLEQKQRNRETIATSLRLEAGPAFDLLSEELNLSPEQTATNPETGQTIYLRDGVWVDENGSPV